MDWTIISVIAGITIALVAGTFALTRFIGQQSEKALRSRLEQAEKQAGDAEKELAALSSSRKAEAIPPPITATDSDSEDEKAQKLAERLSEIEDEKAGLLRALSQGTISSLDPKSELATLIQQLKSEDEKVRGTAIEGLFTLWDPSSFPALSEYFTSDRDEATTIGPSAYEWFNLFISIDPRAGVEFVVSELESERSSFSAFSRLEYKLDSIELIEAALPRLTDIALTSPSTLTRTRSKVLLSILGKRLERLKEQ